MRVHELIWAGPEANKGLIEDTGPGDRVICVGIRALLWTPDTTGELDGENDSHPPRITLRRRCTFRALSNILGTWIWVNPIETCQALKGPIRG